MQANKLGVRDIFCAVRQQTTADDKARVLDELCADNESLRRQVEHLLSAAASTSPLDRMGARLNPTELNAESDPSQLPRVDIENHPLIGPYKLLEQIGEGGMGVVYLAQQNAPIRRTVALKVIKPGMDSRQIVARFEAERQALAMMNHPHIAKVLDAGATESGSPYIVMELVKGIPITEFCDRHKLDVRQRLELFVKVCGAAQHAHQKGIIHRDLKPSNVLVELEDVKAVPKVIDFGVAKATQQALTENTLHTGFSQMIGTPLYMSPEQAQLNSLDVDTRSDIYSLGVLLYELLTGNTPFDRETLKQAGFDEMRRIIREVEPPSPSHRVSTLAMAALSTVCERRQIDPRKLRSSMHGELDCIVMKALEKERIRRYESASALAFDIRRYLDGEAVLACSPSAVYRLNKFARRNRPFLISVGITMAFLALGLIVAGTQAYRATMAEVNAREKTRQLSETNSQLTLTNSELGNARLEIQTHSRRTQEMLVSTLLERGSEIYNRGQVTGMLTLLEARRAAEGLPHLVSHTSDFLAVATHLLAGSVIDVYPEPLASAISRDGRHTAWCDLTDVYLEDTHTGQSTTLLVDNLQLLTLSEDPLRNYHDSIGILFSQDGRFLALNNPQQGIIAVWHLQRSSAPPTILRHPISPLNTQSFSVVGERTILFTPDSSTLVTMDHRGTLVIWNANDDFESLKQLTFDVPLSAIAVSSTGNYLAICEHDSPAASDESPAKFSRCHRLDLRNLRKPLASITHNQNNRCVQAAFTNSPEQLVATDVMGNTRCWDMDRSAEVYRLLSAWSEDIDTCMKRNWLALGIRDGTVRISDLTTGDPVAAPLEHGGGGVRRARFSGDGEFLATGGLDETVQFWKLGIIPQRLAIWPQCGTIDQLHISQDSEFVLTKSRTRDRSQPAEVFLRKLPEMRSRKLGSIPTETVGFLSDPEFNRFLVQSLDEKSSQIYSRDGKFLKEGPPSPSEEQKLNSFCFSRDGRNIFVIEGSGLGQNSLNSMRQWDIQSESYSESYLGKEDPEFGWIGGQISDDLYLLGSSSWRARVWNARTAEVIATLSVSGRPYGMSICESRNEFCVGDSSGTVRFFNCATYEPIYPPLKLNGIVRHTCYSGDGKWLAVVCRVKDEHVLHFWCLDGEPPFHSVEMRFPYVGSRLYPLGARSFIFEAQDKEIHAIDLPIPTLDLEQCELSTWVAIGHRRSKSGQLDLIPSAQYREYRQRLTKLTAR